MVIIETPKGGGDERIRMFVQQLLDHGITVDEIAAAANSLLNRSMPIAREGG